MPSNINFKNSSLLVDSNLIGLQQRVDKNGAIGNFALRVNWGISDQFRGVLGKYYAEYDTGGGSNLVNFASDKITSAIRSASKQVKNIPLEGQRNSFNK